MQEFASSASNSRAMNGTGLAVQQVTLMSVKAVSIMVRLPHVRIAARLILAMLITCTLA